MRFGIKIRRTDPTYLSGPPASRLDEIDEMSPNNQDTIGVIFIRYYI